MTDARAKEELQELLNWYDSYNRPAIGNALRHALQAIEDRLALIDAYDADSDCYSNQPGKMLPEVVANARLHMNEGA